MMLRVPDRERPVLTRITELWVCVAVMARSLSTEAACEKNLVTSLLTLRTGKEWKLREVRQLAPGHSDEKSGK